MAADLLLYCNRRFRPASGTCPDPGYPAIHDLLLALGLAPEPVLIDGRGYRPDALEFALRRLVSAVISTPRAQNPTGAALDEPRARELRGLLAARDLLPEDAPRLAEALAPSGERPTRTRSA